MDSEFAVLNLKSFESFASEVWMQIQLTTKSALSTLLFEPQTRVWLQIWSQSQSQSFAISKLKRRQNAFRMAPSGAFIGTNKQLIASKSLQSRFRIASESSQNRLRIASVSSQSRLRMNFKLLKLPSVSKAPLFHNAIYSSVSMSSAH